MANELPYFRFTVQAWQNGKIDIERYELKGFFISICGYYWIQDCSISLALLQKKFNNNSMINELIDAEIIKINRRSEVEISFLNEQFDLLSKKRKARQDAGSKGGNAKAMLKQKGSYKDKDNNKIIIKEDNIDSRKLKFASTLEPFIEIYGKDLLNDFYKYWTEPNKSKTKFRQELEKTWDLERRLGTWAKNDKNFNKGKKDFTTHITTVLQQRDIDFKQFEQQHGNNEDTKRLD